MKQFLEHCLTDEIIQPTDEGYSIDLGDKVLHYSRFDGGFVALDMGMVYEYPNLKNDEHGLLGFATGLLKAGYLQPIENGYQLITKKHHAILDDQGWRVSMLD